MDKQQENNYFEQIVSEATHNVGSHRDRKLIEGIGELSHEDLDKLLPPRRKRAKEIRMTIFRLAAACIVVAIVIVGIGHLYIGRNVQHASASLFNTYYKEYKMTSTSFDAAGDRINALGGKSTAAYIEEASTLISKKHSKHDLRRGIHLLERLLTYNYKVSLANEIHWYLGLGYLKDNLNDKAKAEFRIVVELERSQGISVHSRNAQDIIRQMGQ